MPRKALLFGLVTLLVAGGASYRAQDTPLDVVSTPADIQRIADNLEDIAISLRALMADQNALLMMRRVELAEQRVAPLSRTVRNAKQDAENRETEIMELSSMRQHLDNQVEKAMREGQDPQTIDEREEIPRLDAIIELRRTQLEDDRRKVIESEDELARARRRIEVLDEKLEELLEALEP